ncbi:HAMP domain-containing protein [Aquabacterium sp.]|uniref:HAMP domain-containing protein n=1 Tax=Aquabacterium sp. TaxID=1872578 RepID=UPI0037847E29
MKRLFTRFPGRLSVSRKLMLISLLDLSAVIFVSSILLNEKFIAIDFARKELAGNAYISALRPTLFAPAREDPPAAADPASLVAQVSAVELRQGPGMRSADASEALLAALQPPAVRTRYLVLEGRLIATARGIDSDFAEALAAAADSQLRQALQPGRAELLTRIESFRAASRAMLHEGGAARIAGFFTRMWLHLGTALFLLAMILTAVFFVARQIAWPLRRLSEVADTVRRTGDHTLRAEWQSKDEIGRLVDGFNEMLAQLDHERGIQQELAATARAAVAEGVESEAVAEARPLA